MPTKRMKKETEQSPILIYDAEKQDKQIEDYLDLCNFVMNEAATECRGLLLRGTSQYNDRAIRLLAEQNNDFERAKLHVLFPLQMANSETRRALEEMVLEQRPSIQQLIVETVDVFKKEK
jgi:hypothetical protein